MFRVRDGGLSCRNVSDPWVCSTTAPNLNLNPTISSYPSLPEITKPGNVDRNLDVLPLLNSTNMRPDLAGFNELY